MPCGLDEVDEPEIWAGHVLFLLYDAGICDCSQLRSKLVDDMGKGYCSRLVLVSVQGTVAVAPRP